MSLATLKDSVFNSKETLNIHLLRYRADTEAQFLPQERDGLA